MQEGESVRDRVTDTQQDVYESENGEKDRKNDGYKKKRGREGK